MLRVLVYAFAAVSALVAAGVVGLYVYLARLPLDQVLEKGREYVDKQVEGVRRFSDVIRQAKETARPVTGGGGEADGDIERMLEQLLEASSRRAPSPLPGEEGAASDSGGAGGAGAGEALASTGGPPGGAVKRTVPDRSSRVVETPAPENPVTGDAPDVGRPAADASSAGPGGETDTARGKGPSSVMAGAGDASGTAAREDAEKGGSGSGGKVPVLATHRVKKGDTLYRLSLRYYKTGAKWKRIAEANRLRKPYHIKPGQVLVIPLPEGAVPKKGENGKFPVVVSGKDIKPLSYKGGRGL